MILSELFRDRDSGVSDQMWKEAISNFKAMGGVNIKIPVYIKSKGNNIFMYKSDISNELRTQVLKSIFKNLSVYIKVTKGLPEDRIAGKMFEFYYQYTDNNGKVGQVPITQLKYIDNEFVL